MAEIQPGKRASSSQLRRDDHLEESAADVASVVGAAAALGALGLSAAQAYYARASYHLQRDSAQYDPGFGGSNDYDPGFGGSNDYDPGFAGSSDYDPGFAGKDEFDPSPPEGIEPVLDLTLDTEPPHGRGGQEYHPGFEDLDY